ncbi:MAG: hypothetical protein KGQ93_11990 [Cyanobacteria bacterium REEB459]|nr:hypothetical protein [Cyanobacteria bacterium REEB459]
MSRYLIGVLLASLFLSVGWGGASRLFADSSQTPTNSNNQSSDGLGSAPVEQAGRLVKRQSQPGSAGIRAVGANAGGSKTAASPNSSLTPKPFPPNVVPSVSAVAPVAPTGDISPIQPDLVKPENLRPQNQPLDSVPALW